MAWSIIREATEEDNNRLDATARRFVERHHIDVSAERDIYGYYLAISGAGEEDSYLRKLWIGCVHRALRHDNAEGIAYGKVGYSVK